MIRRNQTIPKSIPTYLHPHDDRFFFLPTFPQNHRRRKKKENGGRQAAAEDSLDMNDK